MKLLGIGAAGAAAFQVSWLTWPSAQGTIVAGALFVLVWQLWAVRRHLNQHVDMVLLMTGYGGLGMLPGGPTCHATWESWLTMTAGMLLLGMPPMVWGSRCLAAARQRHQLTLYLVADVVGMILGMGVAHLVVSHDRMLAHTAMVIGMIGGMGLGRGVLFAVLVHPRTVSESRTVRR